MSRCIDSDLGNLLHDFELGLLDDVDRPRFELHLYDCEYCCEELQRFESSARLISHDSDLASLISRLSETEPESEKTAPTVHKIAPWKYLVAAALIAAVALPAYWLWPERQETANIQRLEFMPLRSGGSDVVSAQQGGELVIEFYITNNTGDRVAATADLLITSINGDTILAERDFSEIDDNGMGTLTLPVADFTPDHYILSIVPQTDSAAGGAIQYFFRVK